MSSTLRDSSIQDVAHPVWQERKSILGEWTVALILALAVALIIRTFFFEAFRIPSESMEDTLVAGDFVLVSKLHYGPRLPVTVGIPFTNLYLKDVLFPSLRFPGIKEVERNEVIVFNVPAEPYPVDRKTHYIKRVVAVAGDTLRIVNKVPVVNGNSEISRDEIKQMWLAYPEKENHIPISRLKEMGIYQIIPPRRRGDPIQFEASVSVARELESWSEISHTEAVVRGSSIRKRIFPPQSNFSLDNYGPIYIPQKGDSVQLTDNNWGLYKDLIARFEGNKAIRVGKNAFLINGEMKSHYIIQQDYFFVMGDNRDSSLDSRTWGFVPGDHIVGKALLIYFSWDSVAGKVRSNRMFKKIF